MSMSGQESAPQEPQSKLRILLDLSGAIGRAKGPQEIYRAALHALAHALAADRAAVLLFDPDGVLRFEEGVGLSGEYRRSGNLHSRWQRGVRDSQPIAVSNVTQETFLSDGWQMFAQAGIRAGAVFTLIGSGGMIGEIVLYYDAIHEFQLEELQLAEVIAGHVALTAERQIAEAALRHGELLNKQICDSIPECIFLLDVTLDGRFKFRAFNPAEEKAVGLKISEVSGKFIEDVLSEEVSQKVIAHYRRCLETGSTVSYEEELDLEAGRRYFHTNLIPVRNASGRIHRIAGCCTDLTDVKREHEHALGRQKLESVGVLANGIAHDFNNLLAGILAEAEVAALHLEDGTSPLAGIRRISLAAGRGAEIVRELMIYAGEENEASLEPVNLSRLVHEMLELLKISISKHAVLKTDLPQDLPAVLGRASQIRQIVLNLVTNASEAIGDSGGVIEVTTTRASAPDPDSPPNLPSGDYLNLKVCDTGCGIAEELKEKIFDPFFSTKFAGRGLGLAVVQGIVRDHGGAINLVSSPGKGTEIAILLPCVSGMPQSSHPDIARASEKKLPPRSGMVLVVEDEEMLRLAVSRLLRDHGFGVIEAGDGSSALEQVRGHRDEIDVMLLDVTLPGVSSREVLDGARQVCPNLRVILTSAFSRSNVDASFAGARIERFIRKPFQIVDLLALLQDAANDS
jgi:two-component system, cell cycle sensor histidine kinase and response regulator CckA